MTKEEQAKTCRNCKEFKLLTEFNKATARKDGRRLICRLCSKEAARLYLLNPIKKAERNAYRDEYRKNPSVIERRNKYMKQWHVDNKDNQKAYQRSEKTRDRCNKRSRERRILEPLFKLRNNIGRRTSRAFHSKGFVKKHRNEEMLGCSYAFMKEHLVSQFTKGMTLDNYGEWHIDHIIPLASAKNEKELISLAHYTNLQPLWAIDNMKKGAKIL